MFKVSQHNSRLYFPPEGLEWLKLGFGAFYLQIWNHEIRNPVIDTLPFPLLFGDVLFILYSTDSSYSQVPLATNFVRADTL